MAKFKSSFFSDESYQYKSDVTEKIYKDLKANPSYIVARCEKKDEVNSPANIKLDTEVDSTQKRNWEVNDKSDIEKICEGYLEYKPDSITLYSLVPDSMTSMMVTDYHTKESMIYVWDSKLKSLTLK